MEPCGLPSCDKRAVEVLGSTFCDTCAPNKPHTSKSGPRIVTNMPTVWANTIASFSEAHELSGSPDLLITSYMILLYSICDLLSIDLVPQVGLEPTRHKDMSF